MKRALIFVANRNFLKEALEQKTKLEVDGYEATVVCDSKSVVCFHDANGHPASDNPKSFEVLQGWPELIAQGRIGVPHTMKTVATLRGLPDSERITIKYVNHRIAPVDKIVSFNPQITARRVDAILAPNGDFKVAAPIT